MHRRRFLSLLLALAAVSAMAVGSSGVTAIEASRGLEVSVADADEALVGVQVCEKSNGAGTGAGGNGANAKHNAANPVWVYVTNRHADPFVVDAVRADGLSDPGETVTPGETVRLESIKADGPVTIRVVGGGFESNVTVPVTSKANCPYHPSDAN